MVSKYEAQLAPEGILYAGVFTGNPLLVTDKDANGTPEGISPDLAKLIAELLGVRLKITPFDKQDDLVEAISDGRCGIGLLGSDPVRATKVTFSPAYVEIPASFIVSSKSNINSIEEVDRTLVRVSSYKNSAYDLWLVRNTHNATIVHEASYQASFKSFIENDLDALAGLRKTLEADVAKIPGARVLDGQFMAVQQAIATANSNDMGIDFLREFTQDVKSSGVIRSLIESHNVSGLVIPGNN